MYNTLEPLGIISIHAPTRGATLYDAEGGSSKEFQSTLPQGERLLLFIIKLLSNLFQSTLPQGERRNLVLTLLGTLYFNPRSHKGSDLDANKSDLAEAISIHAPTRGATIFCYF